MLSNNLRRIAGFQSGLVGKNFGVNAFRFLSTTAAAESNTAVDPQEYRKLHQIVMKGDNADIYDPFTEFESAPFLPELKKILLREGYSAPTPIQAQSWPIILDDKDVISVARTGSGKTVGFLLPAFQQLIVEKKSPKQTDSNSRRRGGQAPTVLVLAPTRELTVQIENEAKKYCTMGVKSLAMYGGTSKNPQITALRQGLDVAICTPGRCNDLNIMGALDLSKIKYLVLDEADRMLDMGFEPQIREIVDQLPEKRQTIFFTATWPREVQSLARSFLNNPIQINVGDDSELNANKKIKQVILETNPRDKLNLLMDTIHNEINAGKKPRECPKTIVFVARKADCDYVSDMLHDEGFQTEALHGDKAQNQRDRTMDRFRSGQVKILVATDVAARGLDVKDIQNVVNYDFPNSVEDYVHRIGRTARGENTGTSYTFLTMNELRNAGNMKELHGVVQRCEQEIPSFLTIAANAGGRGGGGGGQRQGSNRYGAPSASRRGGERGGGFSGFASRDSGRGGGGFGGRDSGRGGGGFGSREFSERGGFSSRDSGRGGDSWGASGVRSFAAPRTSGGGRDSGFGANPYMNSNNNSRAKSASWDDDESDKSYTRKPSQSSFSQKRSSDDFDY